MADSQINLAEIADFDLGGLHVSPARREVGFNGERHEIEPRVAQVLVALATARPDVVSRQRLIDQCWDGRIVSDDAVNRCIVTLRRLAKQFTPEPFVIETVARVGYCLVESPAGVVSAARAAPLPWRGVAAVLTLVLVAISLPLGIGWSRAQRVDPGPASIAVMPFRNLSNGDSFFAEGISEEILGQLAREPTFRVAGSTSSRQFGAKPDIAEVGRRLNVAYILEGSVRTQGDQVRVNADLVRAKDGRRLWSDSFDGETKDIFAIQQRIGGSIAGALKRKLVHAPAASGPLVTNGEAYNRYLTARGLLRTRQRVVGQTAVNLLRDAINSDPGYAPAWASLSMATLLDGAAGGPEASIAVVPEVERYARHALELSPESSEAHRALGIVAGYGSPQSREHFRRAVEIEPNSAESVVLLGVAQGSAGQFDDELASYRRAAELDPLWFRSVGAVSIALAEMGDRPGAEALVRRGFAHDEANRNILLGRIALIFGDHSEAARCWSLVANSNSPRWSGTAQRSLAEARYTLGLTSTPAPATPRAYEQHRRYKAWVDSPPTPVLWQSRNRNAIAADQYRVDNLAAAKLMLNAGRTQELLATYRSPVGLLSLHPGQALRVDQMSEAAVVALTLKRAGLSDESDQLLRAADAAVREVLRHSKTPFWFDADAAGIWAAQGRSDEALTVLEQAVRRGWTHAGVADLRDINDEPAFKSLHGSPRFERLRIALAAHLAREKEETLRLGVLETRPAQAAAK
jgi:TolB-like protein/DNA-binding winged helix-turn-helix (wHTH) protein/tetratricopeptide (TPR) repeat protein